MQFEEGTGAERSSNYTNVLVPNKQTKSRATYRGLELLLLPYTIQLSDVCEAPLQVGVKEGGGPVNSLSPNRLVVSMGKLKGPNTARDGLTI